MIIRLNSADLPIMARVKRALPSAAQLHAEPELATMVVCGVRFTRTPANMWATGMLTLQEYAPGVWWASAADSSTYTATTPYDAFCKAYSQSPTFRAEADRLSFVAPRQDAQSARPKPGDMVTVLFLGRATEPISESDPMPLAQQMTARSTKDTVGVIANFAIAWNGTQLGGTYPVRPYIHAGSGVTAVLNVIIEDEQWKAIVGADETTDGPSDQEYAGYGRVAVQRDRSGWRAAAGDQYSVQGQPVVFPPHSFGSSPPDSISLVHEPKLHWPQRPHLDTRQVTPEPAPQPTHCQCGAELMGPRQSLWRQCGDCLVPAVPGQPPPTPRIYDNPPHRPTHLSRTARYHLDRTSVDAHPGWEE